MIPQTGFDTRTVVRHDNIRIILITSAQDSLIILQGRRSVSMMI